MQAAPVHRWGLGFIAMRWRHVFWLLPLLGALLGFGLQYWELFGPTATGFIQVRPMVLSSVRTHPADVPKLLQSDEFLTKAVDSLDLPARWNIAPGTCVVKLRGMLHSEVVSGTSLVEVRVSDFNRREGIEMWKVLLTHTNQHFVDMRNVDDDAKLEAMEATIKVLEVDLDQKRRKLSIALAQSNPMVGATDSADARQRQAELEKLKTDFEAARKTLEAAKIHLISSQMGCGLMGNPIISHEEPILSPSWTHWEALRPLLLRAGIGLNIGVLLTAPLAYLFELLFPRRLLGLDSET